MISLLQIFAADGACQTSFVGLPTWHKYLNHMKAPDCGVEIVGINDVWLIVAAIVEIMLRLAALIAVGYIMWGGYDYLTSQAEPEKTKRGKSTVIAALVGLVIATMATGIVSFLASQVTK